jgi:hypothetical protein
MSIDRNGNTLWEVDPGETGIHMFTVIIDDNKGCELVLPITIRIGFE